jgi:hypothetical protein
MALAGPAPSRLAATDCRVLVGSLGCRSSSTQSAMKSEPTTFKHNELGSPETLDVEFARLVSKLPTRLGEGVETPPTAQNVTEITTVGHDKLESAGKEIEFALLLAELINTVKQDPEQLRLTIYDFARVKLKNDLSWATESERERLLGSLETAIRGVEKFSSRSDQIQWLSGPKPVAKKPALPGTGPIVYLNDGNDVAGEAPRLIDVSAKSSRRRFLSPQRVAVVSILLLFAFGGLLAGSMVVGSIYLMRDKLVQAIWPPGPEKLTRQASDDAPKVQPPAPNPPEFPIPGDYGVYAINEGKLNELDMLSEQIPDKRIAMSTPVTQPSRTTLTNGRAKFVVYRRDLANNAPERVDVRVVARVARALTFDSKGKPTSASVSGAWNIRNITYGFRIRPVLGNAEMLLIQPENAEFVLPAGRYVLVLKNQGYDFTVAGPMTDPSQCLERTEAANGTFYSECQKS